MNLWTYDYIWYRKAVCFCGFYINDVCDNNFGIDDICNELNLVCICGATIQYDYTKSHVADCIVILEEWFYFQEFSFMSCPANPDAVFRDIGPNVEFCIIILEEW